MNCHAARKKITDALAGEVMLPPDVAVHRANCVECQVVYEKQCQLFASIDAALQDSVNQPVPLSFLLRLRTPLDQAPEPRSRWVPLWTYGALAAAMVLALSIVVFRNYYRRSDSIPEPDRINVRVEERPGPDARLASGETAAPPPAPIRADKKVSPAPLQISQSSPEVIVLAEEQHAYARFVAKSRHAPELSSALKAAALEQTDAPIDIALIEIQDVEIPPLDSINGDGQ
jgi:hypothetical protein